MARQLLYMYLFIKMCRRPGQVPYPTGDERTRSVRPHVHHERRHAQQVSARGLDQARVLPALVFLLSLRVSVLRKCYMFGVIRGAYRCLAQLFDT